MIMQLLVTGFSGLLIALSFYLGSKFVSKFLKGLMGSKWKNFVIAIFGFIIIIVILTVATLLIA